MFYLKLKFSHDWDDIVIIRNFIITILSRKITNYDEAYRVALVASELMENACRYSTIGGASIELEQGINETHIEFRIKNITKEENIKEFEKIFHIINTGSAGEAYKEMMLRVINRNDETISQLGLARIRYEGQSEISYEIESDLEPLLKGSERIDSQKQRILCVKSKMSIIPKKIGEAHGI
ncbi:MAG: hypothetical protein JXB88_02605 [Spirochaetales bacterium]|nr:hypothetical protein [Spirochaetales bacterium]